MKKHSNDTPLTEQQIRLNEKLRRELGGAAVEALEDPNVFEIQLNPDGQMWADCFGTGKRLLDVVNKNRALNIVGTVAGMLGLEATAEKPIVEGELPLDESRFSGSIPPIVKAAQFSIRKKAIQIFTLDSYVASGTMTQEQVDCIKEHVRKKHNILVVGGTGSGKTTLCNAILAYIMEIDPNRRIVIIEDTRELQVTGHDVVAYKTSDHISMQRLLKLTLRQSPDSIVVGEVRDKTALDLIKAWNTGHGGGVSTVHADSAEEGLTRIEDLIAEAGIVPNPRTIGYAIQCVISIQKNKASPTGRKVEEVLTIKGGDKDGYDIEEN